MISGIYKITNTTNGKSYYGSSVDIHKRWSQHKADLTHDHHHNLHLQRAWNKYGEIAFEFLIVELVEPNLLLEREQEYLDSNEFGYNIAPACGGDILSNHPNKADIIARITETLRNTYASMTPEQRKTVCGRSGSTNGMYGKSHSDEARSLISEANKGHSRNKGIPKSKEHRAKISAMASQRTGEKNPFFGKQHSDETKERMSTLRRENCWIKGIDPAALPYTKVYELTHPSGEVERIYGLKEIATRFGVSITAIYLIIKRGRPNKSGALKDILITDITPKSAS